MVWSLTATYYEWSTGHASSDVISLFDDLGKLEEYMRSEECRAWWVGEDFEYFHVHKWAVNEIDKGVAFRDGYHPRHRHYNADGELMQAGEDSE